MQMALSPAELYAGAEVALIAEITGSEPRWSEGPRGDVETVVDLAVVEVWKGGDAPTSLVLPGGVLGDLGTWVEDVPDLEIDRAYLLLLVRDGDGWAILGGERGALPVAIDPGVPGFTPDDLRAAMGGL